MAKRKKQALKKTVDNAALPADRPLIVTAHLKKLGISRATLYRWIKSGKITVHNKLGPSYLFPDEFQRYAWTIQYEREAKKLKTAAWRAKSLNISRATYYRHLKLGRIAITSNGTVIRVY